ncbi:hypothetical protein C0993_006913 [Termitomyces sp. T159_Od127]|nr:hypothetical protein C0993_006913 [Termitomyces sp. T159_Od127]
MPLAGRPPYATDEPDSFYESGPAPHRRLRQPAPPNPNDRSSAYDVCVPVANVFDPVLLSPSYNNYLSDDHAGNRQSGVNALGLGLMNMADDDDDGDAPPPPPSKHAALAAAIAAPSKRPSPPPQHIVAPRPGYAAPIAALNLARPEPAASKGPSPVNFKIGSPPNPFADPHPVSTSPPMVSNEPHPLQPPVTPITPVFARPKPNVTFSETAIPRPPKPIVRGNTEDTLLPSRGEKGDDFWRRFSMVVKEENSKSPSQKTR